MKFERATACLLQASVFLQINFGHKKKGLTFAKPRFIC
jgi:hypothetical protein